MKTLFVSIIALLFSITISAQTNEKEILGTWMSDNRNSKYEFYKEDNKYYSKLIWIKEPKDGARAGDVVIKELIYNSKKNLFEEGIFSWGKNRLDCEIKLLNNSELELKITKMLFTRVVIWQKVK